MSSIWGEAGNDQRWRPLLEAAEAAICKEAAENAKVEAYHRIQACQSPIEVVLGLLLLAEFAWVPYTIGDDPKIYFQHPVLAGKYRADIVLRDDVEDIAIVVECDGHDYHERTKEQAVRDRKRDRAMTAAGLHVLRFTGSEIARDAKACLKEIARLYYRLSLGDEAAQEIEEMDRQEGPGGEARR